MNDVTSPALVSDSAYRRSLGAGGDRTTAAVPPMLSADNLGEGAAELSADNLREGSAELSADNSPACRLPQLPKSEGLHPQSAETRIQFVA
jgi:hypothetical protein